MAARAAQFHLPERENGTNMNSSPACPSSVSASWHPPTTMATITFRSSSRADCCRNITIANNLVALGKSVSPKLSKIRHFSECRSGRRLSRPAGV